MMKIVHLNRLVSLLIGLCCLAGFPITLLAQTSSSPAPKRDGEIERLQRRLERIETELEQLKQRRPREERTAAEPASMTLPVVEPASSEGQEPPLEQLIREFRGELDCLGKRIGVLNQKLDQRLGMSMYLTTEFEAFQHRKAEFAGAKLELFPSMKLTDRIRAFGEFEFNSTIDTGPDNPTAPDRGKVELDQAWLEYSVNELFKARTGVVLVPFGRYNLEPFDPVQEFTARPIFIRKVIPVVWSEVGAGFTGRATLGSGEGDGWFKSTAIEYQAFVLNGLDNNISDQEGLRSARGAFLRTTTITRQSSAGY